jgi:acid phosphatase (class A)
MSRFLFRSGVIAMLAIAGCQTGAPSRVESGQPASLASSKDPAPKYLDAAALGRLDSFLPDSPPEHGSLTRGEIELMLAIRAEATPAARERAKSEEHFSVWGFSQVLGPGFSKAKMPKTASLLAGVERDSGIVSSRLKKNWARPRPPAQDDRIVPSVDLPKSASYPSGHSIHAMTCARILALLAPAKEADLLQMARLVGYDRVVGGVHFPTDVAAGLALGDEIARQIIASPGFQADLANARSEWESNVP